VVDKQGKLLSLYFLIDLDVRLGARARRIHNDLQFVLRR
jgi:hypothetical protein